MHGLKYIAEPERSYIEKVLFIQVDLKDLSRFIERNDGVWNGVGFPVSAGSVGIHLLLLADVDEMGGIADANFPGYSPLPAEELVLPGHHHLQR